MIPVALFGLDEAATDRFYAALTDLTIDAYDDRRYLDTMFAIEGDLRLEHLHIIDQWADHDPMALPDEIVQELLITLDTVRYPDVSLLEHLLTLDGVDTVRLSHWLHFVTNVYPIHDPDACQRLGELGLETPFRTDDIAAYGLYVERIEGLKEHAPAGALPEVPLRVNAFSNSGWRRGERESSHHPRQVAVRRRRLGRGVDLRPHRGDAHSSRARRHAPVRHGRADVPVDPEMARTQR